MGRNYSGRSFRPPEPVETGRILAGNDRKRPEPTGTDRFRHVPCNRIPAGFRRENSDDFPVGTNRNKLEFVLQKTDRNPVARNMAEHNGTGGFRPSKNHLGSYGSCTHPHPQVESILDDLFQHQPITSMQYTEMIAKRGNVRLDYLSFLPDARKLGILDVFSSFSLF